MAVSADEDSTTGDVFLTVQLQEYRASFPTTVRTIASQWATGLKTFLGLAGTIGLVSAPFAVDHLSSTTQRIVGFLLALVMALAAIALYLVMSAAYGTAKTVAPPTSLTGLANLRSRQAESQRKGLIAGRWLAAGSLLFLIVAIVFAWANPFSSDPANVVTLKTAEGVVVCGTLLDAADGFVAVDASDEGRFEVSLGNILEIASSTSCDD